MLKNRFYSIIFCLILTLSTSCSENQKTENKTENKSNAPEIKVPDFNADSAFAHIRSQVEFGARVPNSKAHKACGDFLLAKLKSYTPHVIEQKGNATTYDGVRLEMRNFIASFQPEKQNRLLLFAHWDTRPWADQDSVRTREPIDGADDGGSGVGVLLEIARHLSVTNPSMGIDIILFDAEDWGSKNSDETTRDSYSLGTQYWARNPHVPGYTATYGILLDMVGAKNARFRLEGYSMDYASYLAETIWKTAARLGYSEYFVMERGGYSVDDHIHVINYGIPSVDIIGGNPATRAGFGTHWHTHADNLEIIDPKTLKAVGQTVLTVLYQQGVL